MGRSTLVTASVAAVAALLLTAGCTSDDGADGRSDGTTTVTSTTAVPRPSASTVADLLALDRPIVLAHAGGDDIHPHDTPFGFDRSAAAGVDALDMDVQLSADGVLVVQHDGTVDRTTEATGEVGAMTYEQLHALDAAYWFTEDCTCTGRPDDEYLYRGVRRGDRPAPDGSDADDFAITSFEQIAGDHPDAVLNVEIKGEGAQGEAAAAALARVVADRDLSDRIVVSSFDDAVLESFATAAPDVTISPGLAALTAYVLEKTAPPAGRTILQVPPEYSGVTVVTPEWVQAAHDDGMVVWVWPNDAEWETADGYGRLLDMGVDGLNAADPITAIDVVRSRS